MKFSAKKITLAVSAAVAILSPTASFSQVKVGVINSLTGNFSAFGQRYQNGMELAIEDINKAGGVNGQKLEMVVQDDRSDAQSALAAVESMKNNKMPLVIGSYASSITGPVAKLMTRQKMPLLVLGSADDSITKPGSPWVFRAKHDTTIVANTYFNYFDHLKTKDPSLKKVAMLYGNGAWPTSLAEGGKALAKARGYDVVASQSYDQGTTDFRPILNRFRGDAPDILYICSYAEDGVAITRQLKEVGLNTKVIAMDTSSSLPSYVQQVGNLSEYVVSVVSWSKDVKYDGAEDLNKRLGEKIKGEPSFYEAEGYLAMRVAADALKRAKSQAPDDVREAMAATNLKTAVSDVVFESKDGFQNQNPIKSLVVQIQKGKHLTVFPTELSKNSIEFPNQPWDKR